MRLATILDHATAADPSGVLLYFHTPAEAEAFLADYTRSVCEGAPPQTGGGDAPDEIALDYSAKSRLANSAAEGLDGALLIKTGGDAGERAREDELDDDVRRGGPEYFRAALQESRREGHREGAEAMREACARWIAERAEQAHCPGDFDKAEAAIRALPIPGKTDAG